MTRRPIHFTGRQRKTRQHSPSRTTQTGTKSGHDLTRNPLRPRRSTPRVPLVPPDRPPRTVQFLLWLKALLTGLFVALGTWCGKVLGMVQQAGADLLARWPRLALALSRVGTWLRAGTALLRRGRRAVARH